MKMIKLQSNIGDEFQKQMKEWFHDHPEINHFWDGRNLKIWHPVNHNKSINFELSSKSIIIEYEDERIEFNKRLFKNLSEQVLNIRGYWINELLTKKELSIRKPKLKDYQFSVVLTNSRYGQVLTIDRNIFTGWGEVFKVFDNLENARDYGLSQRDKEIECIIFDAKDEFIEQIK